MLLFLLRTNPGSQDRRNNSRSGSQTQVSRFHSLFACPVPYVITYPLAIKSTNFPPSRPVTALRFQSLSALPSAMTSPFVLPFLHGSPLVAINPNIDTLNSVPLATDRSPDLLFAMFCHSSATDLNVLLVYAQESLDASITNGRRIWMVLHSDGAMWRFSSNISGLLNVTRVWVQSPTVHRFMAMWHRQ